MAAYVTLAEMRTRARELADMQTSNQAAAFVTDAELTRAINRNIKQLYQKLIIARGDDYYAQTTTIAVIGSGIILTLFSPPFMSLLSLSATDGTRVVWVPKFSLKQWAELKYLENVGVADLGMYRYRLMNDSLEIRPACNNASHSFILHYLPAFTPLVNDADTFDGINGWEDWACYGAAIDMLNKEESLEQAQGLMAQRALLDDQIEKLAGNRDAGMPEVVGDTMHDFGDYSARRLRNDWNW